MEWDLAAGICTAHAILSASDRCPSRTAWRSCAQGCCELQAGRQGSFQQSLQLHEGGWEIMSALAGSPQPQDSPLKLCVHNTWVQRICCDICIQWQPPSKFICEEDVC